MIFLRLFLFILGIFLFLLGQNLYKSNYVFSGLSATCIGLGMAIDMVFMQFPFILNYL